MILGFVWRRMVQEETDYLPAPRAPHLGQWASPWQSPPEVPGGGGNSTTSSTPMPSLAPISTTDQTLRKISMLSNSSEPPLTTHPVQVDSDSLTSFKTCPSDSNLASLIVPRGTADPAYKSPIPLPVAVNNNATPPAGPGHTPRVPTQQPQSRPLTPVPTLVHSRTPVPNFPQAPTEGAPAPAPAQAPAQVAAPIHNNPLVSPFLKCNSCQNEYITERDLKKHFEFAHDVNSQKLSPVDATLKKISMLSNSSEPPLCTQPRPVQVQLPPASENVIGGVRHLVRDMWQFHELFILLLLPASRHFRFRRPPAPCDLASRTINLLWKKEKPTYRRKKTRIFLNGLSWELRRLCAAICYKIEWVFVLFTAHHYFIIKKRIWNNTR